MFLKYAKATLRSRSASLHSSRLTSDNRKMPRLGIFPNFLSLRFRKLRLSLTFGKIARYARDLPNGSRCPQSVDIARAIVALATSPNCGYTTCPSKLARARPATSHNRDPLSEIIIHSYRAYWREYNRGIINLKFFYELKLWIKIYLTTK